MFHNADRSIEFHVVFCHFRNLEFHADIVQVVIEDRMIYGPIATERRTAAVFKEHRDGGFRTARLFDMGQGYGNGGQNAGGDRLRPHGYAE